MRHDLNLMMQVAADAAAGRQPDETYTSAMRAMWHRVAHELEVVRSKNPSAMLWVPSDVDGLPLPPPKPPTPHGDDFDESQHPRDESGKFSAGGGGEAKVKESLGTVGKLREAQGPKWKSGVAQNTRARELDEQAEKRAKEMIAAQKAANPNYNERDNRARAIAGQEAGEKEYKQQLAENADKPMSMAESEYNRRYVAGEKAAEQARMHTREGIGEFEESKLNKYGYDPDAVHRREQNLAQESLILPKKGVGLYEGGKEAKELEERLHEALKNNARLGEHGKDPKDVIAEVHDRIAKEREADERRQAAAKERAAAVEAAVNKEAAMEARYALALKGSDASATEQAKQALDEARAERAKFRPQAVDRPSTDDQRRQLAEREIVSTKNLGGGANSSKVAVLDDNTKAVYKPAEGEEYGLRTNIEGGTYYLREAAASRVAEQLGCADLVPATVTHDGPDGEGSLQSWVPNSAPLGERYDAVFDRDASERMRVYDYITGNSDRHDMNVMVVEKEGRTLPVLIDNGLAFPNGNPNRFIQPWDNIPHEPLSSSTERMINKIDHVKLAVTLAESGIERKAVQYAVARAEHLKRAPETLDADEGSVDSHSSYAWDGRNPTMDEKDYANTVLEHPDVEAAFRRAGS